MNPSLRLLYLYVFEMMVQSRNILIIIILLWTSVLFLLWCSCFVVSVPAAKEDAGDAEQDAAADAWERSVTSPRAEQTWAAAPPAVSPVNDSETFRHWTWISPVNSGCTFIFSLVLCIVCLPGGFLVFLWLSVCPLWASCCGVTVLTYII